MSLIKIPDQINLRERERVYSGSELKGSVYHNKEVMVGGRSLKHIHHTCSQIKATIRNREQWMHALLPLSSSFSPGSPQWADLPTTINVNHPYAFPEAYLCMVLGFGQLDNWTINTNHRISEVI